MSPRPPRLPRPPSPPSPGLEELERSRPRFERGWDWDVETEQPLFFSEISTNGLLEGLAMFGFWAWVFFQE